MTVRKPILVYYTCPECTSSARYVARGRGDVVVRLLTSHLGEHVSIPGGVAPGNRAGQCRWSAGFLGDLSFPPPLRSDAAPFSPHFILIDSQDADMSIHCKQKDKGSGRDERRKETTNVRYCPPCDLEIYKWMGRGCRFATVRYGTSAGGMTIHTRPCVYRLFTLVPILSATGMRIFADGVPFGILPASAFSIKWNVAIVGSKPLDTDTMLVSGGLAQALACADFPAHMRIAVAGTAVEGEAGNQARKLTLTAVKQVSHDARFISRKISYENAN
ncbi:hypothetical protein PR048_017294 [Dryococelus australis]|uniref:Uncharacterized protein n=1 Tax=Dryococelus australis TaxID=614101 RepID=A0ABQ9H9Q8_9NEOP|nr:hypothetical protein PR048_017294 [Dryococelus australis]